MVCAFSLKENFKEEKRFHILTVRFTFTLQLSGMIRSDWLSKAERQQMPFCKVSVLDLLQENDSCTQNAFWNYISNCFSS